MIVSSPAAIARILAGGLLMGIANIIPGVSGGTMILAMGLYEMFVESVAEITRMRIRPRHLLFLGLLGISAVAAILAMVGPINYGLTHHQHIMFALFIGLTLGGVPLIWKQMRPVSATGYDGAATGFIGMVLITFALSELDLPASAIFLFAGGVIGAAAMVLPGISGSYLLLALGLYFPVTNGLDAFKVALNAGDIEAARGPALGVLLPVGLGVLVGIAGLSNLLKAALARFHQPTMGCLLGLLLGSIFFLNPFKEPGHKDPFTSAAPATPLNIALVAGCIVLGFALTYFVSRLGGEEERTD
jgi:putative membrane protein